MDTCVGLRVYIITLGLQKVWSTGEMGKPLSTLRASLWMGVSPVGMQGKAASIVLEREGRMIWGLTANSWVNLQLILLLVIVEGSCSICHGREHSYMDEVK